MFSYIIFLIIVILLSFIFARMKFKVYTKIILISLLSPIVMICIGIIVDGYIDPFWVISYGVQFVISLIVSAIVLIVISS